VLKKAGIVVAASAVSVLAISPLAFAGGKDDDRDRDRGGRDKGDSTQVNQIDNERSNNQNGLINLGDVNALNDVNVCPSVAASGGIGNLLGILGAAESEASSDDVTCVNDDSITQFNND
jgi:hypothetical protein